MNNFQKELEFLINKYSLESGSDTPDFILAEYLNGCLVNFNQTLKVREKWYGRAPVCFEGPKPPEPVEIDGQHYFDCKAPDCYCDNTTGCSDKNL